MDRLTSIIAGVDFTPGSAAALAQAVRIAGWNQARLQAVHIIETLVAMDLQGGMTPYVQEIEDGLTAEARASWATFGNDIPGKNSIEFDVAINNPLAELIRRVNDRKADLLVLGSHGTSPGPTPGILAAQAVRRVPTRVLLVRDKHAGPFKTIVACVDFSETSRDALDAAVRLAAQDGAALHILHVFHPPWSRLRSANKVPDYAAPLKAALLEQLKSFATPGRPELEWSKASFDVVEATGHGTGITDFVRSQGCDLVVLGTRGRTNLRDVLMGSTAERVVRDAPCSLLAIKPRDVSVSQG
jgi:universal stress protein E